MLKAGEIKMIEIKNISKSYNDLQVFQNFNLNINKGQIICLLGASGCGKTTLLNMLSGLVKYDSGCIEGVNDKSFSYIFQETRLLPWSTLEENITFVLKSKYDKSTSQDLANEYLNLVDLQEYKDYYPHQLSGGMKQRVSIARGFAYGSEVLLMDEPFKGLDFELKSSLISDFISLWENDKRTVLFVTHDFDEALLLADVIYMLHGRPVKIKNKINIEIPQNIRKLESEVLVSYKNMIKDELSLLNFLQKDI